MSRIGRMPVEIPAGVTVTVNGNTVTTKGPKGTLTQNFSERITIAVEGNQVIVTRPTDEKEDRSLHGLTRALVQNMVTGVSTGYRKVLLVIGVGYKVVKTGKDLQLYLGHSLMPGKGVPQAKYIISETDTVKLLVPTEAEIKYIVQLSGWGIIPSLFSSNMSYWSAQSAIQVNQQGQVSTTNSTSALVRCVYDTWYWGTEQMPVEDRKTFVYGDKQR